MPAAPNHENEATEAQPLFDPLERTYEPWARPLRTRWPEMFPQRSRDEEAIPVHEQRENGVTTVRVDLPGVDPEKELFLSAANGTLRIEAERHEGSYTARAGHLCKQSRPGSLLRVLRLPDGTKASDITAEYVDGILEIHIPSPQHQPVTNIPIRKG
jgi:HSP20 family protein